MRSTPRLQAILTPRLTKYVPHEPTPKQSAFLWLPVREAFYGGAASGGKSDALLMAALQYVDMPGYAALLFRRTYRDLSLPGALIDRAQQWLSPTDAKWDDSEHTWRFPSGATVSFGYLDSHNDQYRYQGSELQFIGFDELTQFEEAQYRYLFSRLRRLKGVEIPIRMRAASNPGGVGHEWVRQRFIEADRSTGRVFIPARIEDNPHIDAEEYERALAELDPVTRLQLRSGDWTAKPSGTKFKRDWFEIVDQSPATAKRVRYWDLAATEPKPGKDPDYTVGALLSESQGVYYLLDVRRARTTPMGVEALIRQTAEVDGRETTVWIEQEPGSSGVNTIDRYQRSVLQGFAVYGSRSTGSKEIRANPLSSAAQAGNVKLVRGPWIKAFLDEAEAFPTSGVHDDQVDAASGALEKLAKPQAWSRTRPI